MTIKPHLLRKTVDHVYSLSSLEHDSLFFEFLDTMYYQVSEEFYKYYKHSTILFI